MNGQKYLDLLKNKLELHMAVHKCSVFMQDGAPCHRAKIVTQFLKTQKMNILDWPGNSPDPNPMEWRAKSGGEHAKTFVGCNQSQGWSNKILTFLKTFN